MKYPECGITFEEFQIIVKSSIPLEYGTLEDLSTYGDNGRLQSILYRFTTRWSFNAHRQFMYEYNSQQPKRWSCYERRPNYDNFIQTNRGDFLSEALKSNTSHRETRDGFYL